MMLFSRHNPSPLTPPSVLGLMCRRQICLGLGEGAGGCRAALITGPETHQRHPAQALWASSKLPAKRGFAPDLHLVSLYGNRKQLLVGEGET